ncbi:MAG: Unknown protein [uncultured Sulfurovum sp.]|uniref:PoNi C-terminal domain-containing protein n=1 Tax=uncultured Sulfurovum sp. TaxID=269237 RepID=A0A6S6SE94_9BACT|nr:MAG: Unknown protein [uncultured Sulfurovum sp.]
MLMLVVNLYYKENEMTRDRLKEEKVYRKDIAWNEEAILEFKELFYIEKDISEKNERQWNGAIGDYYFDLLFMHYSVGDDIEVMKPILSETIKYKAIGWRTLHGTYADPEYFDLVTMISLGVLLDISNEEALVLMKMRSVVPEHDIVLDSMLKTLLTTKQFEEYSKNFIDNGYREDVIGAIEPYGHIKPLLELKDKKEQQKYMKNNYLKKWYGRCRKEMTWHDRHERDMNYYYGYWSFESVALTKILGLDDSSYKDNKYYPKDMIREKNE